MKRLLSLIALCLLVVGTANAATPLANSLAAGDSSHDYVNGICKLCSAPNPVSAEDGVYLIYNAGHLVSYAQEYLANENVCKADVRLMADIDLSTYCHPALASEGMEQCSWIPIGLESRPFAGTFDGNGHSISGLYINDEDATKNGYGLFHSCYSASFQNLSISGDITVANNSAKIGMLVGKAEGSTFTNISSSGYIDVPSGQSSVGGIVGELWYIVVYNTYSTTVAERHIESFTQGHLKRCSNYVNVTALGLCEAGGLVGRGSEIIAEQCSNSGYITGFYSTGGILGDLVNNQNWEIDVRSKFCDLANYGTITAQQGGSGGIVGSVSSGKIECSSLLNTGDVVGSNGSYPICPSSEGFIRMDHLYYDSSKKAGQDVCDPTAEYVGSPVTPGQLRSGEVAYLLNDRKSTADVVWRQRVDVEPEQNVPRLNGSNIVYERKYTNCQNKAIDDRVFYSNDSQTAKLFNGTGHVYAEQEGHCRYCYDLCDLPKDAEGYYLVTSLDDLLWFRDQIKREHVDYNARLTADIDLRSVCGQSMGKSWTPIESMTMAPFRGAFDGQGHTISGLYINSATSQINGLFGEVSGKVCNLTVKGDIAASNYCGLIAAKTRTTSARIENCKAQGQIICRGSRAGGIVGEGYGMITDCENQASVAASQYVGGIVGHHTNGTVSRCFNKGKIESVEGAQQGDVYAGGIAGFVDASRQTFFLNCASIADVQGQRSVGGLIGGAQGKTVVLGGCWFHANLVDAAEGDDFVDLLLGNVSTTTTVTWERCYYKSNSEKEKYQSKYGSPISALDFSMGRAALWLGAPWGQNIDLDSDTRESTPVLGGVPVFWNGMITNFSIGLLPYLVKMAQKEDKYTKEDIDNAVTRLLK